jgi:hypothetical protein
MKDFDIVENRLKGEMDAVNKSYVFQLNKMMFDELYFKEKSSDLCCLNLNIEPEPKPEVPKYAKEMIHEDNKKFNFDILQKTYSLAALFTKPNIIQATQKVKTLMDAMKGKFHLYKTKFNDTIKLDDFLKEEKKNIYEFKKNLENEQIAQIKKILSVLEFKPPEMSLLSTSPDVAKKEEKEKKEENEKKEIGKKEEKEKKEGNEKKEIEKKEEKEKKEENEKKEIEKKEEKEIKKKENNLLIEEFRKQVKEMEQEERNKYLERRKKERDLCDYQRKQAEEKRKRALTEFNEEENNAYKNKYLIYKEQDDFLNFAEDQIKKYSKEGKNINPMLIQLRKYKKECIS